MKRFISVLLTLLILVNAGRKNRSVKTGPRDLF